VLKFSKKTLSVAVNRQLEQPHMLLKLLMVFHVCSTAFKGLC